MLTDSSPEFTRPTYSSMIFGLLPAAWTMEGPAMCFGMAPVYATCRGACCPIAETRTPFLRGTRDARLPSASAVRSRILSQSVSGRRRFVPLVLLAASVYLCLAATYAVRLQRNMDEFGTARVALSLLEKVPYRDFCPPKTLLAYYIQLPMLVALDDGWDALTAARLQMVLLWTAALVAAAFALRGIVSERSLAAALLMLGVMSNFVERSFELRADGVSAIFGLISLLCLLRARPALAGLFAALSFLATQKGIFFVAAGACALGAVLVRDRTLASLKATLAYSACSAAAAAGYLAFWAAAGSLHGLLACVFSNSNVTVALQSRYDIRALYWGQTLLRNPGFYLLSAAGIAALSVAWPGRRSSAAEDLLAPYAVAILALALWHKQPWPYFFVNVAPTLFVVCAFALERLDARLEGKPRAKLLTTALLVLGAGVPLLRLPATFSQTSDYQEALFRTGERLLDKGERYLDGTGMLYRREQASALLEWVDKPRAETVRGLSRAELRALAGEIDAAPTKLVIWNYRIAALPASLREALLARFVPLYGNIFFYAPTIDRPRFDLAFGGAYRILGGASGLSIDGRSVAPGAVVDLARGAHTFSGPARLLLLPPPSLEVDPLFNHPRDPFDSIYSY